MKASIKKKAKKVMTDLLASSVGRSWAGIIADYVFDDVNAESVKSRMGKVLEKLLYDL